MSRDHDAMTCYRARNLGSDLRIFALTLTALLVAAMTLVTR